MKIVLVTMKIKTKMNYQHCVQESSCSNASNLKEERYSSLFHTMNSHSVMCLGLRFVMGLCLHLVKRKKVKFYKQVHGYRPHFLSHITLQNTKKLSIIPIHSSTKSFQWSGKTQLSTGI